MLGGISIPAISVINGILEKMEGGDYDGALKQANALKGPFQKMFSNARRKNA